MRHGRPIGPGVALVLALAGQSLVGESAQAPASSPAGSPFDTLHVRSIRPASMSGRFRCRKPHVRFDERGPETGPW